MTKRPALKLPLRFEEAVSDLLKVKPPEKPRRTKKSRKAGRAKKP